MNWKNILNWLLGGIFWAAGTTLTAFQIVPGMDWKMALTLAGSTFTAALLQHLRESISLVEKP